MSSLDEFARDKLAALADAGLARRITETRRGGSRLRKGTAAS